MTTRCLGCRTLIADGSRCRDCWRAERRARARPEAYGGTGWAWQRIRATVISRDGGCVLRAEGACAGPLRVDHVVPVVDGGTAALGNLRALCLEHHRQQPTTHGGG